MNPTWTEKVRAILVKPSKVFQPWELRTAAYFRNLSKSASHDKALNEIWSSMVAIIPKILKFILILQNIVHDFALYVFVFELPIFASTPTATGY